MGNTLIVVFFSIIPRILDWLLVLGRVVILVLFVFANPLPYIAWVGAYIIAQIRAIVDQFASIGGPNSRHHQPNMHHAEEDDKYSVESERVNPFAEHRAQRDYPMVQAHTNWWETRFKLNIPPPRLVVCRLQIHLLISSYVKEEEEFVEFQEYECVDEDFKEYEFVDEEFQHDEDVENPSQWFVDWNSPLTYDTDIDDEDLW